MVQDSSKKEELVSSAYEVFQRDGVHSTGIDTVLKSSSISKRTLYKYFRSKDELVLETLLKYHQDTLSFLENWFLSSTKTLSQKIAGIFDLKKESLEKSNLVGCYSMSVRMEYENKNEEIQLSCLNFNDSLQKLIKAELQKEKIKQAESVSKQITILLQGSMVLGQFYKSGEYYSLAKQLALKLI